MSSLEELLVTGQLVKARSEAQHLLTIDPRRVDALVTLAKLGVLDGDFASAEEHVALAEASGPSVDTRLIRATLARQRGDFSAARALYREAMAIDEGRAEVLFGLGTLDIADGKLDEAQKLLEQAVENEPSSGVYHFALADCLAKLGRVEPTLEHLQEAIRVTPMYSPPYAMLARVYLFIGQLEQARATLEAGLKLSPNDPLLLSMMTDVGLLMGDVGSAFHAAVTLAKRYPTDPIAQANAALLLMAQRRFDEVLAVCKAVEKQGRSTGQLKMIEAMTLEGKDPVDIEGAIKAYEEAMALDPTDWRAASNLGQLYLREKPVSPERSTERAVTVLEEACRRKPAQIEPMLNLAIAYAVAKKNDKAKERARAVLSYQLPENHPIREQATRLLKSLGG